MIERHLRRIEAMQKTLAEGDEGAFLVSSPVNVGYLTGFRGENTPLLILPDRAVAITDFRFVGQIREECPGLECHVRPVHQKLWDAVAEVVSGLGVSRLAFEAGGMLVAEAEAVRASLTTTAMKGVLGRVERLRAIKEPEEVQALRKSISVAQGVPDVPRRAPHGRDGGGGPGTPGGIFEAVRGVVCVVRTDPGGGRAIGPASREAVGEARLGDSEFLLVDWGASVDGYKSDLTRVLLTGNVGSTFENVYRTVLAAQERAIAAIRPGARARDVDAEARSVIEEAGFGGFFGHGLGHGVGLAIHESPWLRPDSEDVLQAHMVVTVEPGIYLPHWGGVRIEDDVLVTPEGAEVLSQTPRSRDSLLPY